MVSRALYWIKKGFMANMPDNVRITRGAILVIIGPISEKGGYRGLIPDIREHPESYTDYKNASGVLYRI